MTALLGLATRLRLAKLMLITDARSPSGDLLSFAETAFDSGVDIIQLRELSGDQDASLAALVTLARAAAGRKALVSSYGPIELAERAESDLVQLSAMYGETSQARRRLHPWALIGRSCHSPAQVNAAIADSEISFFTVSPVFSSAGVGEAGLDLVRHASAAAPSTDVGAKPWFAVGGINSESLDQVLAAGARRVGVTRAFSRAAEPKAAAAALKERLVKAWRDDPDADQLALNLFS